MTASPNDVCTEHDLDRDVHDHAPTDCPRCNRAPIPGTADSPYPAGTRPFACLSHTCPDCGSIVHNLVNDRRELIHDCP